MKMKAILFGMIMGLGAWTSQANNLHGEVEKTPECKKPWGLTAEDSLLNVRTYFFYQTAFENGKIDKAYPYWQMIFAKAPCARNDIYIDAPEIYDTLIARTDDAARKKLLLDSLYLSFETRIKHFGNEGYVKGKWALSAAKHEPKNPKKAYDLFHESVKMEGNKTGYDIPIDFMLTSYSLLRNKMIERENAINDYLILNDICKANIKLANEEEDYWVAVSEYIDEIAGSIMTCEQITEIFSPKLKADPTNMELKNTVITLLKAKNCVNVPLYIELLSELIENEPTEEGYAQLAAYFQAKKNYGKANTYLEKAIQYSKDNAAKEDYYLRLASNNLNSNCGSARNYADKVLELNPNSGKAIMIKGHAIYNCNKGACEGYWKKALAWVAVDYMIKAKTADPTVADEANKFIANYKSRYPTDQEKFFQGHSDGQSISIPCSGLTTTVK